MDENDNISFQSHLQVDFTDSISKNHENIIRQPSLDSSPIEHDEHKELDQLPVLKSIGAQKHNSCC